MRNDRSFSLALRSCRVSCDASSADEDEASAAVGVACDAEACFDDSKLADGVGVGPGAAGGLSLSDGIIIGPERCWAASVSTIDCVLSLSMMLEVAFSSSIRCSDPNDSE